MDNFQLTKKIANLTEKTCENRPEKGFISDYEDVADIICQMVANQLGLDESQVRLSSLFIEDLGADSLDLVELVMALEEEFLVDFPEEDAVKMKTVENAVDYVYDQLIEGIDIDPDDEEEEW